MRTPPIVRTSVLLLLGAAIPLSAHAADPLVPCQDGYTYRCSFDLMCGCVAKYPIRSRKTQKKPAFVVNPNDKLQFIAALPHDTAPTCVATLDVEVRDQRGAVFSIEHEVLDKGKPLLIVAEDVESEPVASRLSEPRVLSTSVTAEFEGCTAAEALDFEAVFVIDSGDDTAMRTKELALSFESLDDSGPPPVYPAFGFPPGLFRNGVER